MHRLLLLLLSVNSARAHMSPFLSAMYGGPLDYPDLQNPVSPLGPGLQFDDWWFRGPTVRNAPPKDGEVAVLPAGGNFTLEIACAPEYTTYDGSDPNGNVACDDPGPYHADPDALVVNPELLSGCAIGISDVTDPNDATMETFTIISVQSECVWTRNTTFSIPAKMPSCTGDWCICGWVWSPQTGTSNAYHTPFRCKITDSPPDAQPIAPPNDPVYCPDSRDDCTKGAKRLISTYNWPVNVPFTSNYDRPGYHDTFGFFDGPQDDIFLAASPVATSPSSLSSTTTSFSQILASTSTTETFRSSGTTTRGTSTSFSKSTASTPGIPTSSSKIVWTQVSTTTPRWAQVPTTTRSFATSVTSRTPSPSSPRRVPFKDRTTTSPPSRAPRIPFASRLSALPITTIRDSSPSRPQTTRKTFKQRQLDLEMSIEKKAVSHKTAKTTTRRRNFGSSDSDGSMAFGVADRLVEKMKHLADGPEPKPVQEEKLVWRKVEL